MTGLVSRATRWARLLPVIAASTALMAGATHAGPVEPIRLGISGVMSGPLSVIGEDYREGAHLAVEQINAAGGVLGRPIQLFVVDNQCDPAQGINAAGNLIFAHRVAAFIGSSCSGVTLAVMPVIQRIGIVQLTVGSTNPRITEQAGRGGNIWQFRMNIDDAIMARGTSELLADEARVAAIIAPDNDFGRGAADAFRANLTSKGVRITSTELYTSGQPDFRPLLSKIKAANPEALVVVADAPDAAPMAQQFVELGMSAKIFGRGSVVSAEFVRLVRDNRIWNGAKEVNRWAPSNSRFEQDYARRYGRPPRIHAPLPYYGIHVLAEAIRLARSDERRAIRDALTQVNLTFPELGPVRFNEFHQAHPDMFITQLRDGAVVTLGRRPSLAR